MNRFLLAALVFLPAAAAPLVPGCSSKSSTVQGSNGDASDDSPNTAPIVFTDAAYADDLGMGTGLPDGNGVVTPPFTVACSSNQDCQVPNYVCGYPAGGGCDAGGACVFSQPPMTANGEVEVACGCTGDDVYYVQPGYAASPAASPNACGFEAGAPPDASTDAPTAAAEGGPGDAGIDASAAELGCFESGGTNGKASCCASAGPYPDQCSVGPCSCAPGSSVSTPVCTCPIGMCFSASQSKCVNDQ